MKGDKLIVVNSTYIIRVIGIVKSAIPSILTISANYLRSNALLAAHEFGDGTGGGCQQTIGIVKSALHKGQFVAALKNTPLGAQLAGPGRFQVTGLYLQRGHTGHLGADGVCSVTHRRVEHDGNEATLHDINAVTEVFAYIKFNGARFFRGIDGDYPPA